MRITLMRPGEAQITIPLKFVAQLFHKWLTCKSSRHVPAHIGELARMLVPSRIIM